MFPNMGGMGGMYGMGNGMQQNNQFMEDVPTTKELWKKEKPEYRQWIILFGIGMIVIFAMLLAGIIMNVKNEVNIKKSLFAWAQTHLSIPADIKDKETYMHNWASYYWKMSLVMIQSVKLFFVFIGIVLYTTTVYHSYKQKSFSKISKWATFVVGFGAFMGVWQLFSLISSSPLFSYSEGIFDFINFIFPIVIFAFVSIPLNKIRRSFQISERMEQIKNSPQYKSMQEQMKSNQQNPMGNPYGYNNPYGPSTVNNNMQQPVSPVVNPVVDKEQENSKKNNKITKLNNMKINELKEIAKKLSISGYYYMKKSELVQAIIRITEENN